MRLFLLPLMCLPSAALADSFTLNSAPGAVTVYSDAAVVQREVTLDVPAGQHEVILPGLPLEVSADGLRVSLEGAVLGATQFRRDAVLPQPDQDSPAIVAAEARIDTAEAALRALDDRVAAALLNSDAAQAQAAFLAALGQNDGLPTDVETLRALAQMIGTQTLAANQDALAATQTARDLNDAREDLQTELRDAQAALAALTPPPEKASQLTLALGAPEAGEVTLTLSYLVPASWQPVYDIHLTGQDPAALDLRRGAMVSQWSGEAWQDVALTLSTFTLNTQLAPNEVFPTPLYLQDKIAPLPKVSSRMMESDMAFSSGAAMAEPVMLEQAATANFDGPGVTYVAGTPVSVASGVDAVRVALDTISLEARRFARAAPRFDTTAFLMAEFTNTTAEPLLASRSAAFYLDNTLIGRSGFAQIPAGGEAELPFGPIEDLRLTYTVLDENEGDRGIIRRSNERTETTRMDIQNIGSTDWDVEVQAAVPYATQEDLQISWRASPPPDSQNIKDKRGVLQWDTTVPAGTTSSITIETELKWPEDKVIR